MLIDQIRHITEELGIESPIDSALLKLVHEGYLIYDREGTLLNEGILKKALGVGALAAGMAFGNSGVKQQVVQDDSFGKGNTVHVQQRYNFPQDRYGAPTSYKLPGDVDPKMMNLKKEIELTKKKILATPDSFLRKEGKRDAGMIAKYITDAANKYNIDVDIFLAIAATESNFKHDGTKSGKGARGLMQMMPIAAKDVHVRLRGNPAETFDFDEMLDLKKNIDFAGHKLANLSKSHNNVIEMMLAAYNGGRKQATAWRAEKSNTTTDKDGKPLPKLTGETRKYVELCMRFYKLYKKIDKEAST